MILLFFVSFASEIEVIIIVKNLTERAFVSGELQIQKAGVQTEIINKEHSIITLPKKGKYNFSFKSEDFSAYTIYPSRINKNNHTITIELREKSYMPLFEVHTFLNEVDLSYEQLEQKIKAGTLNFIVHGIQPIAPKEFSHFKEKYGIGLETQNCVVDFSTYNATSKHNKMIANYLTQKHGLDWKKDLKISPFGLK